MVAAEVAALALHAAFLMTLARGAELCREPPMRAERHEPDGLLPPVAPQDLAHGAGQVVVAQQPEHPAEIGKRVLVCLQRTPAVSRAGSRGETLPRWPSTASRIPARGSARRPHRPRPHTSPPGPRGPIRSFAARTSRAGSGPLPACGPGHGCAPSTQRSQHLGTPSGSDDRSAALYAAACAGLAGPRPAPGREGRDPIQLGFDPCRVAMLWRQRTRNRLPHHPTMHAELSPRHRRSCQPQTHAPDGAARTIPLWAFQSTPSLPAEPGKP